MKIPILIERLNERAHDPEQAIDEGDGITSGGKPVVFIAAPPATLAQIVDAEGKLGFRLPDLLRQVYENVGNGGFGPGYGLFGLPTSIDDEKESAVGQYLMLRELQTNPSWPTALLPLCDWGCGIASYLDCSRPEAPVVRLDPNVAKEDVDEFVPQPMHFDNADTVEDACWLEAASLEQWLTDWVNGKKLFYLGYYESDDEASAEDDGDQR